MLLKSILQGWIAVSNGKTKIIKNRAKRELIVERNVAFSRQLAWDGWTLPEHIEHWWGPRHWTATVYEMDVRPEGVWRYRLSPNDGKGEETFCKAIYNQVIKRSKLVYTDSFTNHDWHVVEGSEMYTSVTFKDFNGGTKLTITTQFANVEDLEGNTAMNMIEGFKDAIDRLEGYFGTSN